MIGIPLLDWHEAKQKCDKLIQTDKASVPAEQKLLSDYL
jgi:hypothetical protein